MVAAQDLAPVGVDLGLPQSQQANHVGVGAEASVAHRDPELGAEPGRNQGVVHAVDGEGRHREGLHRVVAPAGAPRGTEQADPVDGPQAVGQHVAQCPLVLGDGRPTDTADRVDGRVQGHGADHVGRAGLLPVGGRRPDDLVEVDEVDRPAAGQKRVTGLEQLPRTDEGAGTERGIELVAAEGQVVGVRRQRPVRCELGGIDHHRDAPVVGGPDDGVERREPSRHVGGAGHRQQRGGRPAGIECLADIVHGERSRLRALDVATLGQPPPGEQVGVVLDHRGHHHVVRPEAETVGQMVDGLRGVAAEDGDIRPLECPPGEGQHRAAGPPRRRRWPSVSGSRRPDGRSSTRGGTPAPGPRPPGGPGSTPPDRARWPVGRHRRCRAPPVRCR